jgi:hypothetical protein
MWLLGWAVMRLGGRHGPGAGWTVAHSIWIVAVVLIGAACVGLFRRAPSVGGGRQVARVALGAALLGTALFLGQLGCDLVLGLTSDDHAAMSAAYDRVFAVPGVELALFQLGPAVLFAGLLALAVLAWRNHRLTGAATLLVLVGIAAQVAGRSLPGWWRVIEGVGGVCLWLALASVPATPARA